MAVGTFQVNSADLTQEQMKRKGGLDGPGILEFGAEILTQHTRPTSSANSEFWSEINNKNMFFVFFSPYLYRKFGRFSPASASASSAAYEAVLVDESPSGALVPLKVPLVVVGFSLLTAGKNYETYKVEVMRWIPERTPESLLTWQSHSVFLLLGDLLLKPYQDSFGHQDFKTPTNENKNKLQHFYGCWFQIYLAYESQHQHGAIDKTGGFK